MTTNPDHCSPEESRPRIIVWFSCGAASAVAAKLTIEKYGVTNRVVIVNCDTRPSEESDNYRFCQDVEAWIGQPILFIRNPDFRTVDDVFERHQYMSGVNGARCTVELKKKPRFAFARPDDTHVFGFTLDEGKRRRQFRANNPELFLLEILADEGILKEDCHAMLQRAGIESPQMYRLGFDNNNCPACVKGSSPWYWDMTRHFFPTVFKRRAEQSRRLGVRLVEISHHKRIFLDELPHGPFKKWNRKKESLSCGPECGGKP